MLVLVIATLIGSGSDILIVSFGVVAFTGAIVTVKLPSGHVVDIFPGHPC
jgi:hypothetical protein